MGKNNKKTTISLSEETKQQLAKFEKSKGESFDNILQRVMINANTLCNRRSDNVIDTEEEE